MALKRSRNRRGHRATSWWQYFVLGVSITLGVSIAGSCLATDPVESVQSGAAAGDQEAMRFFENRIRPLLVSRCFECHSGETAEGGLVLDRSHSLSRGGDSGSPVVPGDLDGSLLIGAVRYEDLEMPPEEPLDANEVKDLERWVATGAFWPADLGDHDLGDPSEPATDGVRPNDSDAAQESWWAAQPITLMLPATSNDFGDQPASFPPASNLIDQYIDVQLQRAGLTRADRADRPHLIRRLSYDLLGLPPTPAQTKAFVNDNAHDAYRRLVDQMLADPAYGERLGRLWLDLVRYAESDGYREDAYRPTASKYRDFVVDAFNDAMPYDQFVKYQIAGDEIDPDNPHALAAAGFLRLGIYEWNQRDAEGQWEVIVDEITDVTADVFLATGLACAKCHDHKFDPIPRGDYFRLRSVFEPLTFLDVKPDAQHLRQRERDNPEIAGLLAELREIEGDKLIKAARGAVDLFPLNVQAMYDKPADQRTSYEEQIAHLVHLQALDVQVRQSKVRGTIGKQNAQRWQQIMDRLRQLDADPRPKRTMMTVADARGKIRPTRLPGRSSGREFEPGVPQLFGGQALSVHRPKQNPDSTGRRLALANWITSDDNPITARVIANRLWQYYFGSGLVETPNDFGNLGQPPSHPDLLDYLAIRLQESDWDLKSLQRELVLSETYTQSVLHDNLQAGMTVDPRNRLHWHRTLRRLDAEQFRDSLLSAMDRVDYQVGGPSLSGTPPRRTIYLQRKRNTSDEMLKLMDAPTGIVGTAQRDVTIHAPQTLLMVNNERLLSVAGTFAKRVVNDLEAGLDQDADTAAPFASRFVRHANYVLTSTRLDQSTESILVQTLAGDDAVDNQAWQQDVCHVLLNSNAFLFVE